MFFMFYVFQRTKNWEPKALLFIVFEFYFLVFKNKKNKKDMKNMFDFQCVFVM